MSIDNSIYEKIELYLSGEMSETDAIAFKADIENDKELKETVDLYSTLQREYSLIENSKAGELTLKETLKNTTPNYFTTSKEAKVFSFKKTYKLLAVAASIVVAFLIIKPLVFTNNKNLFDNYYEQEEIAVQRGETDSILNAIQFFNKKEYQQSLNLLEPITTYKKEANDLILVKGECYLNLNQYDNALQSFEQVAATSSVYKERAVWLVAMCYLKQDKKVACKSSLNTILSTSSFYNRAQKLMKALK
jgi:tetratricopeptide (TPR) repeat protein